MGLASAAGAVAPGSVGLHRRRTAAVTTPRWSRRQLRADLRRASRLQFRRRRGPARRAAHLADHERRRVLPDVRLLLRRQQLALGAELRPEMATPDAPGHLVCRGWTELAPRERWERYEPQSGDGSRRPSRQDAALRRGPVHPRQRKRVSDRGGPELALG